jgi:hypothetical protein
MYLAVFVMMCGNIIFSLLIVNFNILAFVLCNKISFNLHTQSTASSTPKQYPTDLMGRKLILSGCIM